MHERAFERMEGECLVAAADRSRGGGQHGGE
jgi:hypothetical protein